MARNHDRRRIENADTSGEEPTRRDFVRLVGATGGVLAGASAGVPGSASAKVETGAFDNEDPPERHGRTYFECTGRVGIVPSEFPADVQAEIEAALETGAYESEVSPLLPETLDVEESYVRDGGTSYTPVVEETADSTYVLTLEEVEEPTLPDLRYLSVDNGSDESRTLGIRVEDGDEVRYDNVITSHPGTQRYLWWTDVIGRYDLTIEPEDGAVIEDSFVVSESGFTDGVTIEEDGEIHVPQAVASLAECRFEPDDFDRPWIDVSFERERVEPGETVEATIRVSFVRDGLAGFLLEASVSDPAVARITDVSYDDAFEVPREPEFGDDGSSVTLGAAGTVPSEDLYVPLATLELQVTEDVETGPDQPGTELETGVDTSVSRLIDANDDEIELEEPGPIGSRSTLVVPVETEAPICADSESFHRSGRCVDPNGNGRLDSDDVVRYFRHLEDDLVQDNPSVFDVVGDGRVGFQDVVALFEHV